MAPRPETQPIVAHQAIQAIRTAFDTGGIQYKPGAFAPGQHSDSPMRILPPSLPRMRKVAASGGQPDARRAAAQRSL